MGNNKMIKTAAAVALGASVVATAVAPGAASAATTYKLKSGKLVNAKTGKVVKGYKVYKSTLYKDGKKAKGYVTSGKVLYKDGKKHTGLRSAKYYKAGKLATGTFKGVYYKTGKKFTGLKSGVYYKAGVKGTGSYKSVYYKNGKKHTGLVGATYYKAGKKGTGSYKGIQYKSGKAVTGVVNDVYYNNGVKATAVVDGVQYVDGDIANEVYKGVLYVAGKAAQGEVEGKFYNNGKIAQGEVDGVVYVDGIKDVTAPVITVVEAQTVKFGAETPDTTKFVTAVKDNSGEVIEASAVKVSSITLDGKAVEAIDTKVAGEYTVTFTVSDKNGNEGKATVTVIVEKAVFAVTAVTATTVNDVTVEFPALEADQEGVTINVIDNKGVAHEVVAVDLSKGETSATFKYKTAVTVADLTGTWTFGTVAVDFSLQTNLDAFKVATTQTATYTALQTLGIKNLKTELAAKYESGKSAFLAQLTTDKKDLTVAAIQEYVDGINKESISATEEAAIVKTIVDAKGNNIQLAAALQNSVFTKVNSAWVEDLSTALTGYATGLNNITVNSKIADIQTAIDGVNTAVITDKVSALTTTSTNAKDLAAVKALIETYAVKDAEGKYVTTTLNATLKNIEQQNVVIDVLAATTANKFKAALTSLATIVNDKAVLDITAYKEENAAAYIKAIKDANATTVVVNTPALIQAQIKDVNTTSSDETAKAAYDKIVKAVDAITATPTTAQTTALVDALKAVGITSVSTDKANVAEYVAKMTDIKTAATAVTGVTTVATNKATIQAIIAKANIDVAAAAAAATATAAEEKAALVSALAVLEIKDVVADNVLAYATGIVASTAPVTVDSIQAVINDANKKANIAAAVKAINDAKDAATVKVALDTLANNGLITDYLKVTSADRTFVAEKVLEAREELAAGGNRDTAAVAKKFFDEVEVASAVTNATGDRTTAINAVKAIEINTDIDVVAEALLKVGHTALTGKTGAPTVSDTEIAEAFQASLQYTDGKQTTAFKSISDIRAAITALAK